MASRSQVLVPVTAAAVIIGVAGIISIPADHKVDIAEFPRGTVRLDGALFGVQVADTPPLRTRGLMFQDPLPLDEGMLFVFEEPARHSLWMMNMQFALDMMWFDADGLLVHAELGVAPCQSALEAATCVSIAPPVEAVYVLEATAGFAEAHGVGPGSILEVVSV